MLSMFLLVAALMIESCRIVIPIPQTPPKPAQTLTTVKFPHPPKPAGPAITNLTLLWDSLTNQQFVVVNLWYKTNLDNGNWAWKVTVSTNRYQVSNSLPVCFFKVTSSNILTHLVSTN